MTRPPVFDGEQLGQALYTWAETTVVGARGKGFSTINAALAGSVQWLDRLQPKAFRLFPDSSQEQEAALQEASKGFSEVGRMVRDGIGIIYCKSAAGAMDTMKREHELVHAVLGPADVLDLTVLGAVPSDFWIRRIDSATQLTGQLPDLVLTDFAKGRRRAVTDDDGLQARKLLLRIGHAAHGGRAVVDVPESETTLHSILAAIPGELLPHVSVDPYVATDARMLRIEIEVPPGTTSRGPALRGFQERVRRAAAETLFVAAPDLAAYTRAVLAPAHVSPAPHRVAAPPSIDQAVPAAPLLGRQCVQKVPALIADYSADEVLRLPTDALEKLFGNATDRGSLSVLGRALDEVPTARLVTTWNETAIPAFLGLALQRDLDDLEDVRFAPHLLLAQHGSRAVLRSMAQHVHGARSLAVAIAHGLLGSDEARTFLCDVFLTSPKFLYDAVLAQPVIGTQERSDFIRVDFAAWARYRRVPTAEVEALKELMPNGGWTAWLREKMTLLTGKRESS